MHIVIVFPPDYSIQAIVLTFWLVVPSNYWSVSYFGEIDIFEPELFR